VRVGHHRRAPAAAVDENRFVSEPGAVQRGRQPRGAAADNRDLVVVVGRTHYRIVRVASF